MDRSAINEWLGRTWASRIRRRARWAGVYHVARQLRKQGVGLQTALVLLRTVHDGGRSA